MENLKKAIVFGGCGRRSRKTIRSLLDDHYMVVIVDNLIHSEHPQNWPKEENVWEHKNLVFYEEEAVNFMTEENMFSLIDWDVIIHRAKVAYQDNHVDELITNTIIDAHFFKWVRKLNKIPPIIITNQNTSISRDLTRLLELSFQPKFQ